MGIHGTAVVATHGQSGAEAVRSTAPTREFAVVDRTVVERKNEHAVSANTREPAHWLASIAATVKLPVPAETGVPASRPEAASVSPVFGLPSLIENVNGAVPPVAVSVVLYNWPCAPSGSAAGFTVSSAHATSEKPTPVVSVPVSSTTVERANGPRSAASAGRKPETGFGSIW